MVRTYARRVEEDLRTRFDDQRFACGHGEMVRQVYHRIAWPSHYVRICPGVGVIVWRRSRSGGGIRLFRTSFDRIILIACREA